MAPPTKKTPKTTQTAKVGRPPGPEPTVQTSYKIPRSLKAEILTAMAQLRLLDGAEAPSDATAFVVTAIREKVAATAARFSRK